MKVEELRIGNLIFYKGDIIPVTMVGLFGIQSDTKGRHINAKFSTGDLHPIPLSEEVLLKCPEIQTSIWMKEVWNIRDPKSQFHIAKMKGRFLFRGLGMSVVYVDTLHHLQNLVYTVTGEELEVSL